MACSAGRWCGAAVACVLLLACAALLGPASAARATPSSSSNSGSRLADELLTTWLTNEQLAAWQDEFVAKCSSIARKHALGRSVNGVTLWALEIGSSSSSGGSSSQQQAKPAFRYIANMHGDETSGRALLPLLAEWLCAQHTNTSEPRAARIVDGMRLFLVPTLNPDGWARHTRGNAAGIDLNRNFPDVTLACNGSLAGCAAAAQQGGKLRAPGAHTAPEVAAVMNWTLHGGAQFVAAANLHEGSLVANYPFDGYWDGEEDVKPPPESASASPDDATFRHLASTYARAHASMSRSPDFPGGITNGAAWYPIYGGMQDWSYLGAGVMEVTLELNEAKSPPASAIPGLWRANADALLALPTAALLGGVSGRVTAAGGAVPPGAVVWVEGARAFNSSVASPSGYYNRPLAPGSYTLWAAAPGHRPVATAVVVPADGSGAVADFRLPATGSASSGSALAATAPVVLAAASKGSSSNSSSSSSSRSSSKSQSSGRR